MRPSLPRLQPISTVRSRSLWRNAGLCARPVNYRLVQLGRLVHYKFRSVQFVGCERGLTQKNRRPSFCCTSRLVVHCLMSQVRRLILMSRQWTSVWLQTSDTVYVTVICMIQVTVQTAHASELAARILFDRLSREFIGPWLNKVTS